MLLEVVFFSCCFIKKIHKKIKKFFWKKNQKDFEKNEKKSQNDKLAIEKYVFDFYFGPIDLKM